MRRGIFDFNGDGKHSSFEHAAEIAFIHHVTTESEASEEGSFFSDCATSDFDGGETDPDDRESRRMDLLIAGLDEVELSFMDWDERRDAIEAAGLDPDDYDYIT